jgi:hypothetical protein
MIFFRAIVIPPPPLGVINVLSLTQILSMLLCYFKLKYPPCCDVIVAQAVRRFFLIPNSLVIVLYQSDTLCFKTNNNSPEIHIQIRKSLI